MLINSTLEAFYKMTHLYTDLLFIAGYRLGLPIIVTFVIYITVVTSDYFKKYGIK
jgi:hypothetical protein